MEDDSAAGQADLLFPGMPSSGDDPSDDDHDLTAANSEEEDSEDEGLDEEEDELSAHNVRKALKRPREESSGDEDEEGPGNDLLDMPPRKRGLDDIMREFGEDDGLDDDEDDDSDEDDEEWTPWGKPSWVCVNCTCSTGDEYTFCSFCGEHRRSGILQRGFMASPDIPGDAGVAEDGPLYAAEPVQLSEEELRAATAIGTDDKMLLHFEGKPSPHPERPDRLRAIVAGLVHAGLFPNRCVPFPTREAEQSAIESVHTSHHVDEVELTAGCDLKYFTSDTYANANTCQAARLAAGISLDMAAAIASGKLKNGVAVVRPPGHHAESEAIMGFCLHNNAAVAAKAAQAAGAKKILIVDWDVHHGNGTQEIFEGDPSVLYVSLHRHEAGHFYPGTGGVYEVGSGQGAGYSVNIPWPCGNIGDSDYIAAFTRIILPLAYQFAPDMTIISAGFDAAAGDPLGGCQVSPAGYAHMTSLLKPLAQGRMLIVLEGGYNLRSISSSLAACTQVLLGEAPPALPAGLQPSEAGLAVIAEVSAVQARYWTVLGHQEIQVHPIMSGEEEDELDSLQDAKALPRLTSNGDHAGDAGEEALGPHKYWLPPSAPSSLPSPSYPPGAASPHSFTRIPSPRHPSLEPLPSEPVSVPTFTQPGPPRPQPNPLPPAHRPPQVTGMPPPSYVASPIHQPFYYPSPAHPSSYHHPSPAHPSTYHHPSPSRAAMLTSPQHPSQHGAAPAHHPSPAYQNHPQSIFHPPTASPQHHCVPYVTSTVHLKASAPTGPPTVAPLIPRPLNPQQKRPEVARSPSVQPSSTSQPAETMKRSASVTRLSQASPPSDIALPGPALAQPPAVVSAQPSIVLSAQPSTVPAEQPEA
ncbi:Histone deacetylase complex catalytic component HDA1 [Klebsormidium nitens]|uniref:histone deacetylase n=1 Tax=Klebsormidium nitens TaxID=105231 RepID=A0A1Y1IN74_KLENI|nr:Histone deacetylase complex catalytic component HDA1 [Klebsormidium nitens]|eukprot:GAQ90206.1 Histone deacetylase complex catalytic component HDA1 [Klebsormidium nitens]